MGWLSFILFGLIAGAIAKLILPGRQGGGWIATLILGLIGALIGGWLAGLIFGADVYNRFFELSSWVAAIVGSLIVLVVWGFITRGRSRA